VFPWAEPAVRLLPLAKQVELVTTAVAAVGLDDGTVPAYGAFCFV
jgi:hypothetical protein